MIRLVLVVVLVVFTLVYIHNSVTWLCQQQCEIRGSRDMGHGCASVVRKDGKAIHNWRLEEHASAS